MVGGLFSLLKSRGTVLNGLEAGCTIRGHERWPGVQRLSLYSFIRGAAKTSHSPHLIQHL